MRRLATLIVPIAGFGCASTPDLQETCGHPALDRTVLVVEHGDQTASLARVKGGCFAEAPPEIQLGTDQNLLGAHGQPFVGVNDDGALYRIDIDKIALISPGLDAYADGVKSQTVHSIYGVDVDGAGNLWVSRDDVSSLVILRPDGGVVDTVDLRELDKKYFNPRMNGAYIQEPYAYVALDFLPADISDEAERQGGIAVIATAAPHGISRVIDLDGWNPVHQLVPIDAEGKTVIVATPGRHDLAESKDGIDRISLADGTVTQILNESEINASVEEVAWGGEHEVYAITLGTEPGLNPTKVIRFDPTQPPATRDIRELAKAPWFDDQVNGAAYVHSGLVLTKDHVLFCDRTPDEGRGIRGWIRVFSRATGEEVASIPTKVGAPWQLLALPP